jgi:hypothetical protein
MSNIESHEKTNFSFFTQLSVKKAQLLMDTLRAKVVTTTPTAPL